MNLTVYFKYPSPALTVNSVNAKYRSVCLLSAQYLEYSIHSIAIL